MNIKTILVTGASGKLGRSLIPALLGAGYSVRATQFKTPVRIPGVKTTKGSMTDPAFIRRALRGVDAVCHLATCKEDANNFMDVSVKGMYFCISNNSFQNICSRVWLYQIPAGTLR